MLIRTSLELSSCMYIAIVSSVIAPSQPEVEDSWLAEFDKVSVACRYVYTKLYKLCLSAEHVTISKDLYTGCTCIY